MFGLTAGSTQARDRVILSEIISPCCCWIINPKPPIFHLPVVVMKIFSGQRFRCAVFVVSFRKIRPSINSSRCSLSSTSSQRISSSLIFSIMSASVVSTGSVTNASKLLSSKTGSSYCKILGCLNLAKLVASRFKFIRFFS
jgi:hypothetical protein